MRNGFYAVYRGQEYKTGWREEKNRGMISLLSWDKKDLDNGFYCEKSQEYMEQHGFYCVKEVPKSEITEEYRITPYAAYKGFLFQICGSTINNELRLVSQMLSRYNEVDCEITAKITEMGFYVREIDKCGCFYEKLVPIDDPELDTFEVREEIEINKMVYSICNEEYSLYDKYALRGVVSYELFYGTNYVYIYDSTLIEYAEKCARAFDSLSDENIDIICRAMKKYCLWIYPCISEQSEQDKPFGRNDFEYVTKLINQPTDRVMLKHMEFSFFIDKPEDDAIGYCLRCSIYDDRISVVIKDNKVLYIGVDEDRIYTAWSNFPKDDEYNFVNQI